MRSMGKLLKLIWRDRRGATLVEYGLLVALITLAAMIAITNLGTNLGAAHDGVASKAAAAMQ
jgi:pilus assembly protein Flp/PilA